MEILSFRHTCTHTVQTHILLTTTKSVINKINKYLIRLLKKAIFQEYITSRAISNNLDQNRGKDYILSENGADWWWCFFFFIYCPSNLLIYILLPKPVNTFPFSTPSSYIFITFLLIYIYENDIGVCTTETNNQSSVGRTVEIFEEELQYHQHCL